MADINVIVLPDGTEYPVSDYYLPVAISNPTNGQVLKYDAENELWYNGDDAEGSSVFYGTTAPASQLGVDGNLYVKYTEGTGGASDTVDALYVKLDGDWCQISTGGSGGSSTFSGLDDVDLNNLQNGQLAKYNSTTQKWENATLQESDVSGLTDDLDTLGGGENLTDKVPYNFRPSGGDINTSDVDISNRESDKIIGGTVAWNQRVATFNSTITVNGVTFTNNRNGSWTANGTATGGEAAAMAAIGVFATTNHVCLLTGCPTGGSLSTFYLADGVAEKYDIGNGIIYRCGNTQQARMFVKNGTTVNNIVFKPQLIDLTQMFGTEIADYIYSLEQATAGAGVAYFRKLFPKPYYAYNAGELMSVKTSEHITTGFNQWDEEWELGTLTWDGGAPTDSDSYIRAKNYIKVIPNTAYYIKVGAEGLTAYTYDKNFNMKRRVLNSGSNSLFTPQDGEFYIRFRSYIQYTTYNHDICINLSDPSRNGQYEPYIKNSYPLDPNLELRGIPKLDADNKLYYDGDEYSSDGNVKRKYGIVDLGSLNWTYNATYKYFWTTQLVLSYGAKMAAQMICPLYYIPANYAVLSDPTVDKVMAVAYHTQANALNIRNLDYTDATAFKTAMNGVYLVYELAAQTSSRAKPYQNPQIVDDSGTEEYVDTRDVAIPVGHETTYLRNLKEKLEDTPAIPDVNGDYVLRKTNGGAEYVEYDTKPAQIDTLWTGDSASGTANLAHPYTDYDLLILKAYNTNYAAWFTSAFYTKSLALNIQIVVCNGSITNNNRRLTGRFTSTTAFEIVTADGGTSLVEIVGYKFGTGYAVQPIIYSETEREIGTWTDGKPLYEKTFISTTILPYSSDTVLTFDDSIPTGINVIELEGSARCVSSVGTTIYMSENGYWVSFYYNESNNTILGHQMFTSAGLSSSVSVITLRYTKNADAAGSGHWTPQDVPTVHYSTDEKVIGTWIDGKPLYERTYTFTAPSSNAFTREDLGIPMSEIDNAWIDSQNTFATKSSMSSPPAFYDGSPKADQFGCYLNFLQTNLSFDYRVGSDLYSSDIALTIRYTKSS